jgi:hypothetical protein
MFDRHANTAVQTAPDPLDGELEAYNRAFTELELPWHWDVATLRHLLSVAPGQDCVGAYIERHHAHLLRVYEKTFLCELVRSAKERHSA